MSGRFGIVLQKNSSKRKMKEIAAETAKPITPAPENNQTNVLFNLHDQQSASVNVNPPDGSQSQVQQILNNTAATFKPFSFNSLLTAIDHEGAAGNSLSLDLKNMIAEIDQIISTHNENLRRALGEMWANHYEALRRREAEKVQEIESEMQGKLAQNAELERTMMHYRAEAARLQVRVRYLEQAAMSLRSGLQEATAAARRVQEADDAVQDWVGAVRLDCKGCKRELATVMMWPCRHVCVCRGCDGVTQICPVCRSLKTSSVEVYPCSS